VETAPSPTLKKLFHRKDAKDAEEQQNERSKIGIESRVTHRGPLSPQLCVGDHLPMNALNSSLFSLLPFLRVLCASAVNDFSGLVRL
jgi:hypothetical protein